MNSLQLKKSEIQVLCSAVEKYIDYVYAESKKTGRNLREKDTEDIWQLYRRLSKLAHQDNEAAIDEAVLPLSREIW